MHRDSQADTCTNTKIPAPHIAVRNALAHEFAIVDVLRLRMVHRARSELIASMIEGVVPTLTVQRVLNSAPRSLAAMLCSSIKRLETQVQPWDFQGLSAKICLS